MTTDGGYTATSEITVEGAVVYSGGGPTAFPNPSDGQLSLDLNVYKGVSVKVFVFNALQQKVFEAWFGENHGNYEELNITSLANGVYYIVFDIGDGEKETRSVILKFMKLLTVTRNL